MTPARSTPASLYAADYLRWLDATADALKRQDYGAIDWENVIEEIEDMGRRERQSLKSNLVILLLHLLKWQFQPERQSHSWKASIVEHRQRLEDSLEASPSLKPYLETLLPKAYGNAVERAAAETGLAEAAFPQSCPYTISQIMAKGFLP
ncbi:DUF29 domain-containing protein [Nodosilinea sp. PGN35]|uniref:DUF29 domain-containing protein n=1 Tax=Nodosilinea sp. PGN35 TaxID=3020489 RepID=UPI0023B305E0|nr:DUF29 domain-containing protein [Nodosilinea sp. TSF1-S3]MDF0365781.1 DUF29 domain-containing protein [Nodosilinea sp. TSF1-S3]